MTDEELMRAFECGVAPAGGFHHAEHVRAAWTYLRRHSLPEAIVRFTTALKTFAAAQGKPNLYHETITIAFMLIIAERTAQDAGNSSWSAFSGRHPELLQWNPSVLDRYYTHETLWSDRARQSFVMPDRVTLS
jgi:hypothetical protein